MKLVGVGTAAVMVAGAVLTAPGSANAAAGDPTVVTEWNQRAVATLVADTNTAPVADFLYLGFVQAAVYDAVIGVTGGYEPYNFRGTAATGSSAQAAAVTAAHDVLVEYVPSAQADLDTAYAASLAAIDDSDKAVEHGTTFGAHTARHFVKLRRDDGRNADVGFTAAPATGVWRPTPPANAPMMTPWLGGVTPLLIDSATQFAPPLPPALTSATYTADYDEVKAFGRADPGSARSPEQTATARFFSGNALVQYNAGLRAMVGTRHLGITETARMFAATSMSVADGLITVWAEKLRAGFWRPLTAIREGDSDGNPATAGDPTWAPLIANPPYPDYPSGFNVVNSATARVLAHLFGANDINLTLSFTPTGGTTQTRLYTSEAVLCKDVVDARVWLGIHFRFADTAGRDIGFKVADHAMSNYFAQAG